MITKRNAIAVCALILLLSVTVQPPSRAAQMLAYTYDAAGRLTSVTYDDTVRTTFTYDLNGNLLSMATGSATAAPDIPHGAGLPVAFALRGGSPNPLLERTSLRYELPRKSPVRLEIFDVGGRRVRALVHKEVSAGYHQAAWDGRDDRGHPVSSGLYFARIEMEGYRHATPIAVIR